MSQPRRVGDVDILREGEFVILVKEAERLFMHRFNAMPLGQALLEISSGDLSAASEGMGESPY